MLSTPAISAGSGPILLDRVMCTGVETRLWDCVFDDIDNNNCVHSQDAGVRCTAGKNRRLSSTELWCIHVIHSVCRGCCETCRWK